MRNEPINLYNPKNEGLGKYDVHYTNAYNKKNKPALSEEKQYNDRCAA